MEARIKISAPAVAKGSLVDVVAIGEDGRPGDVLATLGNGDGWVLPVGKEGQEILLRVRGS